MKIKTKRETHTFAVNTLNPPAPRATPTFANVLARIEGVVETMWVESCGVAWSAPDAPETVACLAAIADGCGVIVVEDGDTFTGIEPFPDAWGELPGAHWRWDVRRNGGCVAVSARIAMRAESFDRLEAAFGWDVDVREVGTRTVEVSFSCERGRPST